MEQQLQDQISGSINPEAVLDLIRKKPKRNSYRKAAAIVKNSVKGRKTKITKEQGFRNYLQYTDPLLLSNNEIDQSDIATSLANLLNVFAPKKMETPEVQQIKKFVSTEITADPSDIDTEIDNQNKKSAATKIQGLARGVNFRKKELPKLIEADVKDKQRKREEKAATTIQKLARGSRVKQTYNTIKHVLDKLPATKATSFIQGGTPEQPLKIDRSPAKTRNFEKKDAAAKKITKFVRDVGSVKRAEKSGVLDLLKPSEKNPRELRRRR